MKPHYTGLVGDVGGTNARFAMLDGEGRDGEEGISWRLESGAARVREK